MSPRVHYLANGYLGCVPEIPVPGVLVLIDARPSLDRVTCDDCLTSTAAMLAGYVETAPVVVVVEPEPEPVPLVEPEPLAPARCAWCRLLPPADRDEDHDEGSTHGAAVVIRARDGAVFRTTRYEATAEGRPGRPITPWKPPADIGRAFARAVARPVPTPEQVT